MVDKRISAALRLVLIVTAILSSVSLAKSDNLDISIDVVKSGLDRLNTIAQEVDFFRRALNDANEAKPLPAAYSSNQKNIDDMRNLSSALAVLSPFDAPKYIGDYSSSAQQDCRKYESVLPIFQNYFDAYTKYAGSMDQKLPSLQGTLKTLSDDLASRLSDADALTKLYAGLAVNPVEFVREFYAWSFLDLTNLSKAIAEAKGAADKQYSRVMAAPSRIAAGLADAKRVRDDYVARMPAQRRYCTSHGQ